MISQPLSVWIVEHLPAHCFGGFRRQDQPLPPSGSCEGGQLEKCCLSPTVYPRLITQSAFPSAHFACLRASSSTYATLPLCQPPHSQSANPATNPDTPKYNHVSFMLVQTNQCSNFYFPSPDSASLIGIRYKAKPSLWTIFSKIHVPLECVN